MILVDATYIHNGGTKELFLHLVEELKIAEISAFFLIDDRLNIEEAPGIKTFYRVSGVKYYQRHQFFKKHRNQFHKVVCFNNIPPSIKMGCPVYTYLQSTVYLDSDVFPSSWYRLGDYLKRKIFKNTIKFSDHWLVQTSNIKTMFSRKYHICEYDISIIPIFKEKNTIVNSRLKLKNTFLYVSNALRHKNHIPLITAFCKFYDQNKVGKLTLTVDPKYKKVHRFIEQKIKQHYPIENIGIVSQPVLEKYYASCEKYIHPSFTESFGLGLVEAAQFGCTILASDMPYVFEVCKPSFTFNPYSEASMIKAFWVAVYLKLPESQLVVDDEIQKLLNLLK